jgi:lambda repressor-like predicted transcriptional regulator
MRKSKATEALRVASEIAAIKAALKKHGYTIRKQPRQAAWTITPLFPP